MENAKTLTDFERFILDWLGYYETDDVRERERILESL